VLIPRALPIFWIGILLQMAFAYGLGWFPIGGMRTPAFIPETRLEQLPGYDLGVHMVLPLLAAAIYFVTDPLMIMRTSMLEVAGDDFVTFARATGLRERRVRHLARRNAILPVLTYNRHHGVVRVRGQVLLEVVFRGRAWGG